MKKHSKRTRLILGLVFVFLSILLVWLFQDTVGEISLLFLLPGCILFFRLNPELMRGD